MTEINESKNNVNLSSLNGTGRTMTELTVSGCCFASEIQMNHSVVIIITAVNVSFSNRPTSPLFPGSAISKEGKRVGMGSGTA